MAVLLEILQLSKNLTIKSQETSQSKVKKLDTNNTNIIKLSNNSYNGQEQSSRLEEDIIMDNGTELKGFSSAQSINYPKDFLVFYEWYVKEIYLAYKGTAHPRLKKAQKEKVFNSLDSYISENDLDWEVLYDMAEYYFQAVKTCDHNINHFATAGILENRFFEVHYSSRARKDQYHSQYGE